MKHILFIALLVMIALIGAITYLMLAGTAIIYSLGANAHKPRRVFFGILGTAMIYVFICAAVYLIKYGGSTMTVEEELQIAYKEAYSIRPGTSPPGKYIGALPGKSGIIYRYYKDNSGNYHFTCTITERADAEIRAAKKRRREAYYNARNKRNNE